MKKAITCALLGILLCMPFGVFAEITKSVDLDDDNPTNISDTVVSYKLTIKYKNDDATQTNSVVSETVVFKDLASGIKELTCEGSDDFDASKTTDSNGQITCTFTPKTTVEFTGSKELTLGSVKVELNSADSDCSFTWRYGDTEIKTGNFVPYVAIAAGLLLAGGIYAATRKKKMYQI